MRQHPLIAIGSNEVADGDSPQGIVAQAISRLSTRGLPIRAVSRFYATPCFPPGAGPDYVNACIAVQPQDAAQEAENLLRVLHDIEAEFGRTRVQRWGSRTLDLDLIAMGDRVLPDPPTFQHWRDLPLDAQIGQAPDRLILPHPRIQDRAFVLVPLCDIAPLWRHPVLGRTAGAMRDALSPEEIAEIRAL